MADESTLVIVKPDAVRRGLIGQILGRLEAKGLRIEALQLIRIDRHLAERHYSEHRDKPFFAELVEFITSGDVVVAKVSGPSAVAVGQSLAQRERGTARHGLAVTAHRRVRAVASAPQRRRRT